VVFDIVIEVLFVVIVIGSIPVASVAGLYAIIVITLHQSKSVKRVHGRTGSCLDEFS